MDGAGPLHRSQRLYAGDSRQSPLAAPLHENRRHHQSFTDVTVPVPEDAEPVSVFMEPGDVLFFNGSLVHGSYPNTTADQFRRSLIAHYVAGEAEQATRHLNPLYRMDGTTFDIVDSPGGGPCGVWVDQDGKQVVELVGQLENRAVASE
jgi:hypothetical protein